VREPQVNPKLRNIQVRDVVDHIGMCNELLYGERTRMTQFAEYVEDIGEQLQK
jgi:exo-beta-1,3-glucanase (GH17 family)